MLAAPTPSLIPPQPTALLDPSTQQCNSIPTDMRLPCTTTCVLLMAAVTKAARFAVYCIACTWIQGWMKMVSAKVQQAWQQCG